MQRKKNSLHLPDIFQCFISKLIRLLDLVRAVLNGESTGLVIKPYYYQADTVGPLSKPLKHQLLEKLCTVVKES